MQKTIKEMWDSYNKAVLKDEGGIKEQKIFYAGAMSFSHCLGMCERTIQLETEILEHIKSLYSTLSMSE